MAGRISSYQDLIVWQQAMDLVASIYELTGSWPKEELYGLTNQIRRSAVSIPSNIAEGYGRESSASYQHFLRVAQGSLKELETQLMISARVGISNSSAIDPLLTACQSVGKLLRLLIRKLPGA
ncbi:MAG: four helix bundle protein [Rhizobiaceae bacterium]|nr:four helix bundle protein [Rhizobiaceae bacterium]